MWVASMRAANASPKTTQTYLYALRKVIDCLGDLPVDRVSRADVERFISGCQEGMAPSSVSIIYRALRSFWTWACSHPNVEVSKNPMDGMRPPVVPTVLAEFPTQSDMRRVLATTISRSRHAFRAKRDRAILLLMASTGLRLAEVASLQVNDLDLQSEFPTATVMGKGRKERVVPIDPQTGEALRTYIREERSRSPYATTSNLWLNGARGVLTDSGIAQMVRDRGKAVGVTIHPHALRHYAIDQMLRAGMSEGDTMAISGHSSRSMMDRYGQSRRAERADRAFRSLVGASL
jgi:site-specific recombinase XerD